MKRPRSALSSVRSRRGRRDPRDSTDAVYRERLWVPWWWYPVALGIAAVLAAEFRVGGLSLTVWIPFGVLLPLAAGIVAALGRSRVEVSGGEIRVRGAHLPLDVVSGVVGLDASTARLVVGREGDPAAFVSIRSWVGPAVQLWLDDPDDPTPYWLISTRHPQELISVLRQHLGPPLTVGDGDHGGGVNAPAKELKADVGEHRGAPSQPAPTGDAEAEAETAADAKTMAATTEAAPDDDSDAPTR